MRRIILMVLRLLLAAPYYVYRIGKFGKRKPVNYQESFAYIKKVTKKANKAGRVTIEAHGLENIPKENGFILFPNHQGLFDVLAFIESSPVPFSFVFKKEVANVILLKQVIAAMGSIGIDRQDLRQSMEVIKTMAERVKERNNFLIFPEGTRSRKGNELLPFKGGSFKSAQMSHCPIVPCALIDSFVPFDEKSIRPVTVKLYYLPPMYYEEYQNMKSREIALEVQNRIQKVINEVK